MTSTFWTLNVLEYFNNNSCIHLSIILSVCGRKVIASSGYWNTNSTLLEKSIERIRPLWNSSNLRSSAKCLVLTFINMVFCMNWHPNKKGIAIIIIILPYDNPTVIICGIWWTVWTAEEKTIVTYFQKHLYLPTNLPIAIKINFKV